MFYILSKSGFVNCVRYPRNITLLHDTPWRIFCGQHLHSRQYNICTKINKFRRMRLGINLLRFHKVSLISSLAVNWKLMCQVSCSGLGLAHEQRSLISTLFGGPSPTKKVPCHRPCSLKKRGSLLEVHYSSIFWRIWEIFLTCLRAIRLGITILPVLTLYPFTLKFHSLKNVWYNLLLISLEFSGPIFIKLGQWASTRRDLFPEELCLCLEKLQRNNSPHSWFYTSKSFERVFGPDWRNFVTLDNGGEPVGCGCCAQVYKAWLDYDLLKDSERTSRRDSTRHKYDESEYGNSICVEVMEFMGIGSILSRFRRQMIIKDGDEAKKRIPVAIKVLHPRMMPTLRRDLYIMKVAANVSTWMFPSLKWISLPECVDDFTTLMNAQVDLCIEANNLDLFSKNFAKVKTVHFPRPLWSLTTPFLLVETFEDGQPMEYFVKSNETSETNAIIADIGVNTLLKMIFDDNFAHGDLHPGNMLIQHQANCSNDTDLWCKLRNKFMSSPPFRLVILDCGIVVSLDLRGRKLLRQVLRAVTNGEGELVAELFLNNSTHQCPDPEIFKQDMKELVLATVGQASSLDGLKASSLMKELLTTMIHHRVKIDGCFSSVILAMMVVEGMGRSLDPTINMVEMAKPYLFKPFVG